MHRASDVLVKVFNRISSPQADTFIPLFQKWPDLIGKELVGHVQPVRIENKILYLVVEHPGWAQIIKAREREIIKKINQRYKKIGMEKIKVSVGVIE